MLAMLNEQLILAIGLDTMNRQPLDTCTGRRSSIVIATHLRHRVGDIETVCFETHYKFSI